MEHFYSIWTWSTVYQQRFGRLVKDPGRCAEADERGVPAFKMMNLHFRLHLRHNELELCDVSQLGKITTSISQTCYAGQDSCALADSNAARFNTRWYPEKKQILYHYLKKSPSQFSSLVLLLLVPRQVSQWLQSDCRKRPGALKLLSSL